MVFTNKFSFIPTQRCHNLAGDRYRVTTINYIIHMSKVLSVVPLGLSLEIPLKGECRRHDSLVDTMLSSKIAARKIGFFWMLTLFRAEDKMGGLSSTILSSLRDFPRMPDAGSAYRIPRTHLYPFSIPIIAEQFMPVFLFLCQSETYIFK